MHFHPDLDSVAVGIFAQLMQARADVLNRGFGRHVLGKRVGPHLDRPRAGIVREFGELLPDLDLLPALGRIGRLEFAGGAVAQQPHFRPFEAFLHLFARGGVHGRLHFVGMAGAQFHRLVTGTFEFLDNGFHVPVLQDVISNRA